MPSGESKATNWPITARVAANSALIVVTLTVSPVAFEVDVSDSELQARADAWTAPPFKATNGTLWKYIQLVEDASHGCVTDG